MSHHVAGVMSAILASPTYPACLFVASVLFVLYFFCLLPTVTERMPFLYCRLRVHRLLGGELFVGLPLGQSGCKCAGRWTALPTTTPAGSMLGC